jgi:WD40 repeat protein
MRVVVALAVTFALTSCDPSFAQTGGTPTPQSSAIVRPPVLLHVDRPLPLAALPRAGAFTVYGDWRYDGPSGTVARRAQPVPLLEHPAPSRPLMAVERQSRTPGGYAISTELVIRDRGVERVVYRAPVMFYWQGWSPDGRYLALWEVDFFSGSLDLDGRPLVVLDAMSGRRTDLGPTLLRGTAAWTAPHTLAFVAGRFRMVWDEKSVRLWSPESGVETVTPAGKVGFAPAWSADGRSLYFVLGGAGQYEPLAFFAGRGVGDRRIAVYDRATRTTATLEHEAGYVEEGAQLSRDGTRLLVLRRTTVSSSDVSSIPDAPLEIWLTGPSGTHGTALVRVTKIGFGYYGWYPGPDDWDWSE